MSVVEYHRPVMVTEVLEMLAGSRRIADCTFGGGGHTRALIEAGREVIAVDRDPEALANLQQSQPGIVAAIAGGFGDPHVLDELAALKPDGALLDLGVSSHQLDADDRGFSFRPGVELDMRMASQGPTAADLLNDGSEENLASIFREYGDERRGRALAREVVRRRNNKPFTTSDDLVGAIRAVLGPRSGPSDFARIFQAVRIAVNDEMGQLDRALDGLLDIVVDPGTIAVISYHSVEDRIVKNKFAGWERECVCPPKLPVCQCRGRSLGSRVTRKPVEASEPETSANPRARSARLRAFRKAAS